MQREREKFYYYLRTLSLIRLEPGYWPPWAQGCPIEISDSMAKAKILDMFFVALKSSAKKGPRKVGTAQVLALTEDEIKQLFALHGYNVRNHGLAWKEYIGCWMDAGIAFKKGEYIAFLPIDPDFEIELTMSQRSTFELAWGKAREWSEAHDGQCVEGWA